MSVDGTGPPNVREKVRKYLVKKTSNKSKFVNFVINWSINMSGE